MEFKIPFFRKKEVKSADYKSYLVTNNNYHFLDYNNSELAIEGYIQNIIVYKCITLITGQFRKCRYTLYQVGTSGKTKREIENHPLLKLLNRPYPGMSKASFLERLGSQVLIYGENYIQRWYEQNPGKYNQSIPIWLYPLRPDFINNIPGKNHFNSVYQYNPEYDNGINFEVTKLGLSNLMIMRKFNPQNDFHGLSPIVPAGYSIDTHNAFSELTYNLGKNSGTPSGILTVPADRNLTDEEFERIKREVTSQSGPAYAGVPKVLEGGMTWTQISVNPDEMHSNETTKQAAYNIALGFGVPMELINQEQSKFMNKWESYEQLYEDAVLPLTTDYFDLLNAELVPLFGDNLLLEPDYSHAMVMREREDKTMEKLNKIGFLTPNEKRQIVGYEDHPDGETLGGKTSAQNSDDGKEKEKEDEEKYRFIASEIKEGSTVDEAIELLRAIRNA